MVFLWVDREHCYFITNFSSILPGNPYRRTLWRHEENVGTYIEPDRVEFTIPQPKAAEEFYDSCAQIDRHNRSRQANLKIETKYGTNDWDKRVNLTMSFVRSVWIHGI